MKRILYFIIILLAAIASTFVATPAHEHDSRIEVCMQGAHCNGTIGCSCSGFAPITNGDVWQQAYCRKCGHSKSVHR